MEVLKDSSFPFQLYSNDYFLRALKTFFPFFSSFFLPVSVNGLLRAKGELKGTRSDAQLRRRDAVDGFRHGGALEAACRGRPY